MLDKPGKGFESATIEAFMAMEMEHNSLLLDPGTFFL
jgi:hypothetical protein